MGTHTQPHPTAVTLGRTGEPVHSPRADPLLRGAVGQSPPSRPQPGPVARAHGMPRPGGTNILTWMSAWALTQHMCPCVRLCMAVWAGGHLRAHALVPLPTGVLRKWVLHVPTSQWKAWWSCFSP